MTQAYSNPERKDDPHALPDVEVFYLSEGSQQIQPCYALRDFVAEALDDDCYPCAEGWYYWYCFPGCLPDSDPVGPFATEAEAIAAAQEDSDDDDIGDYGVNAGSHIDPTDLA